MNSNVKYINDSITTEVDEEGKTQSKHSQIKIYRSVTLDSKKIRQKEKKRYGYLFIKRTFDIFASLLAIILLSPLFLVIAILIKIDSKGKVVFTQIRIGKNGKPFKFYKFRSMVSDAELRHESLRKMNEMDGPVFKIKNDPRITKIGRILRRTSLDEIPQLLNVLKGEMSFVGPRPLPAYEVEKLNDYQKRRHNVSGGLTCYWQISGRNSIMFDEWIDLDIKYIQERTFITDMVIILKTFKVVFTKKGAY